MLCFLKNEDLNNLHIQYYSDDGQILKEGEIFTDDDNFNWSANAEADLILIEKQDDEGKERNIYLYSDNEMTKVASEGYLSIDGHNISDNGTLLYIADVNAETKAGTLYIKEMGEEAIEIMQNATKSHTISSDGQLVAAVVDEDTLFYQYIGKEAHVVDNVQQYTLGKDNQTIVYTVKTEEPWQYDLYWVRNNSNPIQIAEKISALVEVSGDGSRVAYISNVNEQTRLGDLYLVGNEKNSKYIDSDISISAWASFFRSKLVILNSDGTMVAYLKNYDENYLRGDLFVKQEDEPLLMVDNNVGVNFYFLHEDS
jgi:hypothetical protein